MITAGYFAVLQGQVTDELLRWTYAIGPQNAITALAGLAFLLAVTAARGIHRARTGRRLAPLALDGAARA
jgi:hypothetical protein